MNSLITYKPHLRFVAIISAIAYIGLILFLSTRDSLALEQWQFALTLLPFALFGLTYLLLMYTDWFVPGNQGMLATFKKTFFWILATTYVSVIGALFWNFVV